MALKCLLICLYYSSLLVKFSILANQNINYLTFSVVSGPHSLPLKAHLNAKDLSFTEILWQLQLHSVFY